MERSSAISHWLKFSFLTYLYFRWVIFLPKNEFPRVFLLFLQLGDILTINDYSDRGVPICSKAFLVLHSMQDLFSEEKIPSENHSPIERAVPFWTGRISLPSKKEPSEIVSPHKTCSCILHLAWWRHRFQCLLWVTPVWWEYQIPRVLSQKDTVKD